MVFGDFPLRFDRIVSLSGNAERSGPRLDADRKAVARPGLPLALMKGPASFDRLVGFSQRMILLVSWWR